MEHTQHSRHTEIRAMTLEQQLQASIEIARRDRLLRAKDEQIELLTDRVLKLESKLAGLAEEFDITVPLSVFLTRQAG